VAGNYETAAAILKERVAITPTTDSDHEGGGWVRIFRAPELEVRIRAALKAPGRTEGVRQIARRFGVNPGTVQRISRPLDSSSLGTSA
jgi:hypothetical protein